MFIIVALILFAVIYIFIGGLIIGETEGCDSNDDEKRLDKTGICITLIGISVLLIGIYIANQKIETLSKITSKSIHNIKK